MPLLALCRWIQATHSSTLLRESTWGFTILGALHVLGIAWFGGAVLFSAMRSSLRASLRAGRRAGAVWMLITGALLFWLEPLKCYNSLSFRLKLLFLVLLVFTVLLPPKLAGAVSLTLWAAVILASQGIAFF
jgi:hypothetical protein